MYQLAVGNDLFDLMVCQVLAVFSETHECGSELLNLHLGVDLVLCTVTCDHI
jgi:hypothetical protein